MAEMHDVTDALLKALPSGGAARGEIESIRHATIGIEHLPALLQDPTSIVKEIGVPVREHSQWNVSLVKRPRAVEERVRYIIVVIIHFSECSGVIVVFY
jgi:hypothetical protein